MVVFAVLTVAAAVVLGIYASANGGSHDVTLFGQSWNVHDWVPPVIAASVMGVLLLLCLAYAGNRMGRLRRANLALRADVEKLQGELRLTRDEAGRAAEHAQVAAAAPAYPMAGHEDAGRQEEGVRERELEGSQPATMSPAEYAELHRRMHEEPAFAGAVEPRAGEVPVMGHEAPRQGYAQAPDNGYAAEAPVRGYAAEPVVTERRP